MITNDCTPYSEYFMIDEGYYPEINPNSVKDPKNDWRKTFPHPSFVNFLKKLEMMLARETSGKKHSIWLHGSFGTGKSRVIWAVQNLMACSDETFYAYFNEYDVLRKETDLRDKLLAHKHSRIVTAFRYASGDIDSDRKLIMAIFDSVTEALKNAGYNYLGEHTIRGKVAAWLEDESHQEIFRICTAKPEYRGLGSFAGKTTQDILAQLQGSGSADVLLNDILSMAEKEGISAFKLSMDDLKEWLSDVIDENQLTSLLFLWDEFSSFFRLNKDSLDIFQSLMELCSEKPFEMVIVTHTTYGSGDQQFSTVSDRFMDATIEMPDNVAFDLIGHALKVPEHATDTWKPLANDLASRTPDSRKAVSATVGVQDEVLRKMIPIHPMAALMLKYISENFASNQRSMFNFIKNDDSDDLEAFQWFIREHTPDEGDLLTIDYLWNFFYEKGHDEHSAGSGRSNLDMIVAGIMDTYPTNEKRLNTEQKRILKVVLMMQAISRKLNNGVALLRPTTKNIELAFEGDDSFSTKPTNIVKNQLMNQLKILFESPTDEGAVEYATATVQGDQVKIDQIIERIKAETKTMQLVQLGSLQTAVSWTPAINMRYVFTPVCCDNFQPMLNSISGKTSDYHIQAILCYARDEDEQKKIRYMISEARSDSAKKEIVIIDASGTIMGVDRFNDWAKFAGNEEYWRPKDPTLADNHKGNAGQQLRDWRDAIGNGNFLVYYRDMERTPGTAAQLSKDILPGIVLHRFPLAFDNANVSENFFHADKFPSGAKFGITQTCGGVFQSSSVLPMMAAVWQTEKYWTLPENALLPISKLKKDVDQFILGRFETDIRIAQTEIFDFLIDKGFTPCNLYSFLTGFLLKEYAGEPYRYGIGESGEGGDRMSVDKLSEHVGECIKHRNQPIKNYKEKYIEIMTAEQKAFVDFTAAAFEVPDSSSVEIAASRMRTRLKNLGYPIWCYKSIDTHNLDTFIDRIADIANDRTGDNVPSLAGKLGKMLLDFPSATSNLVELLTKDNGPDAMMEFLSDFRDGQLIALADEIHAPNMLEDVKRVLSSGEYLWLWNQDSGEEELDKMITDYHIVVASNTFAGHNTYEKSTTYSACIKAWRECARFTHIPAATLREKLPELKQWISCIQEIASDGSLASYDKKVQFLTELLNKADEISTFLANRVGIFIEAYSSCMSSLETDDMITIYAKLHPASFTETKTDFVKKVNEQADKAREEQKRFKLSKLWKQLTHSDSPEKWSDLHDTPIIALVPEIEQEMARKAFAAINTGTTNDKEIDAAIDYLSSAPSFLNDMKDQNKIDTAFRKALIGRYYSVLTVADARTELRGRVPTEPYYWLEGTAARSTVEKKAESNYYSGANEDLIKKIDDMGAEKAKEYLKKLVKNYVDVGIQIINEEGD